MERNILQFPDGEYALLHDGPERIKRCLECPLPPGACRGDKDCKLLKGKKCPRSREIVRLIKQGKNRVEIAGELNISSRHIASAVNYAVKCGRLTQAEADGSRARKRAAL